MLLREVDRRCDEKESKLAAAESKGHDDGYRGERGFKDDGSGKEDEEDENDENEDENEVDGGDI